MQSLLGRPYPNAKMRHLKCLPMPLWDRCDLGVPGCGKGTQFDVRIGPEDNTGGGSGARLRAAPYRIAILHHSRHRQGNNCVSLAVAQKGVDLHLGEDTCPTTLLDTSGTDW